VPRVIYITISGSPVTTDTASLEATIRAELTQAIPERFNPVYLKFRRSAASGPLLQRAHWYGRHNGELDRVCEPKNVAFKPTPEIGMSIGPEQIPDAASLGGFVVVEEQLYAMSALRMLLSFSDFVYPPPFSAVFFFCGEGVAVSRKGELFLRHASETAGFSPERAPETVRRD
jgi:hypothetical protein